MYTASKTIDRYERAIKEFLESVYGKGIDPIVVADQYFSEARDHEADVIKFFRSNLNMAPISFKGRISIIRMFLDEGNITLKKSFWRRIRGLIKGSRAISDDKVPTRKELRSIIQHLPIHGKALFLTLPSSGMRINEALQLKLKDIDLNADPVTIDIQAEYTKTKIRRWGFISSEAKEAVEDWLKQRDDYITTSVGRSHLYNKSKEDNRLFPFSEGTSYAMWYNALDKTMFNSRDEKTNRRKFHVHVLRKYFRTNHRAEVDAREALMGHEGYLTGAYRKYSLEQLQEFYKQGEWGILVFKDMDEIKDFKEKLEQRNTELQENSEKLQNIATNFNIENMALRSRINNIESDLAKINKLVFKVVEYVLPGVYERDEIEEFIKSNK
jgi:integrase